MKKTFAVLAVSMLALAGCSNDEPEPVQTVYVQPEATTEAPTEDEEFLALVRDEKPVLEDVSDTELLDFADSICGMMEAGGTPVQLAEIIENNSGGSARTSEALSFLAGASIGTYCPDEAEKFENYL